MKGRVASCFIFISQKIVIDNIHRNTAITFDILTGVSSSKSMIFPMFKLLLRLWLFQCVMCRCCRQFQISPRNELKWKNDVTRGSIDRADNLCWEEGPCVEIFCGAAPPYRDAAAAAHYSAQNFCLTRLRGSIDTWSATKTLGSKRKQDWMG